MTPARIAELRAQCDRAQAVSDGREDPTTPVLVLEVSEARRLLAVIVAFDVAREALTKIEAHEREGYCGVCWGVACDALAKLPPKRSE